MNKFFIYITFLTGTACVNAGVLDAGLNQENVPSKDVGTIVTTPYTAPSYNPSTYNYALDVGGVSVGNPSTYNDRVARYGQLGINY
jgi:hypothetical protein